MREGEGMGGAHGNELVGVGRYDAIGRWKRKPV